MYRHTATDIRLAAGALYAAVPEILAPATRLFQVGRNGQQLDYLLSMKEGTDRLFQFGAASPDVWATPRQRTKATEGRQGPPPPPQLRQTTLNVRSSSQFIISR